jgi:hypothetical protein
MSGKCMAISYAACHDIEITFKFYFNYMSWPTDNYGKVLYDYKVHTFAVIFPSDVKSVLYAQG